MMIVFVSLVSLAVFVVDILTPLGYTEWIMYGVPLFFAARIEGHRALLIFSAVYTLLILLGGWLSPAGVDPAVALSNRLSGIFVLWAIVFLLLQVRKTEEILQKRTAELSRVAASLEKERKFLETVLMDIPAGVLIAEAPSGKLILGNPQVERILRHPFFKSATIGDYREYQGFHADGRPYEPEEWPLARSLLRGEAITGEEINVLRGDGTHGTISVSSSPIRGSEGEIIAGVITFSDISQRKEDEQALRISESRFRQLFEQSPVSMQIFSPDGQTMEVNRAWELLWGTTLAEARTYNALRDEQLVAKGLMPYVRRGFTEEATTIPAVLYDPSETFKGRPRWVTSFIYPVKEEAGAIRQVVLILVDITDRVVAELALRESEERYRVIAETATDAIITIDEASTITFANPATEKLFGYTVAELQGKPLTLLMPERLRKSHLDAMARHIATGERHVPWGGVELPGLHRDGREIPLEISYGEFIKEGVHIITGILRDITERKKAEETIRFQAYHSPLTGLPNRALFVIHLDREQAQAQRTNQKLAVVFLDLDRFKAINDSLGHVMGDQLLREVAERLRSSLKQSDVIAHVGADEFILLLSDIVEPEKIGHAMRRIMTALRQPFNIGNREVYVTASAGISVYPEDGENSEILITNADIAMTHAKEQGRDNYQFFNAALNVRTIERLFFENSLRQSIERGQLVLFYQPLVDIETRKVSCLEALVRWHHPDMGMLSPAQFIPIAEELGLTIPIDEWVLHHACRQRKAWDAAGLPGFCITVNLSARQFLRHDLRERIMGILQDTGLDAHLLEIEITESTAMRDIELAVPNLTRLNEMGIRLAIDDFGTGYSSLTYLKRFPVHSLKIDQSFIRDLVSDMNDQAIVKAVIALGHHMRLKIIAEGVETPDQLGFLRSNGCDEMQGFLFSEPVSAAGIEELLAKKYS